MPSLPIHPHLQRGCGRRVACTAPLALAALLLVWGAFTNAGQNCASIERVYVERPIADKLIARIVELTRGLGPDDDPWGMIGGDADDDPAGGLGPELGLVVDAGHLEADAAAHGTRRRGGRRHRGR